MGFIALNLIRQDQEAEADKANARFHTTLQLVCWALIVTTCVAGYIIEVGGMP